LDGRLTASSWIYGFVTVYGRFPRFVCRHASEKTPPRRAQTGCLAHWHEIGGGRRRSDRAENSRLFGGFLRTPLDIENSIFASENVRTIANALSISFPVALIHVCKWPRITAR
jgi:hypothetical protein